MPLWAQWLLTLQVRPFNTETGIDQRKTETGERAHPHDRSADRRLPVGGVVSGADAASRNELSSTRRADLDPVIEIDHVLIGQANAAR